MTLLHSITLWGELWSPTVVVNVGVVAPHIIIIVQVAPSVDPILSISLSYIHGFYHVWYWYICFGHCKPSASIFASLVSMRPDFLLRESSIAFGSIFRPGPPLWTMLMVHKECCQLLRVKASPAEVSPCWPVAQEAAHAAPAARLQALAHTLDYLLRIVLGLRTLL